MNVLMAWSHGIDDKGFKTLKDILGIKYCAYFGDDCDGEKSLENRALEKVSIYNNTIYVGWENCIKNSKNIPPLDIQTKTALEKYEGTAMEIIYRWRRSITNNYSYSNIKMIYYDYIRYWSYFIDSRKIELLLLPKIKSV